jgi:rhamnose transport system substrate-binding protein
MNGFSRLLTTAGLFLLAVTVFSCTSGEDGSGSGGLRVGVMPKLIGIDFFNAVEKGAKEAAAELGVDLIFNGPTVADVTKQAEMLDTWITRRLDVIAVAPNDKHALGPTLRKARSQGITVLSWDADADENSRDYFVNQATYESIGYVLVDIMAEQIGGKGDVVIVSGTHTAVNQKIWIGHMKERIASKYPGINIVKIEYPGEDQSKSFRVTQDLLKTYPDLDGIFGITSVSLPGAAEAVRAAGKSGKIVVTGLSTPKQMSQYVHDGTVKEFALFSPVDLGYLTVHVAKQVREAGETSLPAKITAGRLGELAVDDAKKMVIMGSPLRFDKKNVDTFDF